MGRTPDLAVDALAVGGNNVAGYNIITLLPA
jgi:hypothetical protein